jgi:hypothetical protein
MGSAATYVSVIVAGDSQAAEEAAATIMRAVAIERLGGEEGLECVDVSRVEHKLVGTWSRTWSPPEPSPAAPMPDELVQEIEQLGSPRGGEGREDADTGNLEIEQQPE